MFEKIKGLYADIGKKMKNAAIVIFIVMSILSILGAIIFLFSDTDYLVDIIGWAIALSIVVGGTVVSFFSTWMLYGFGELIDKTCEIEKNTRDEDKE